MRQEIPRTAQKYSEQDFGGLRHTDTSTSDDQQTKRKHTTKILLQNTLTNNFTEVSDASNKNKL